MKLSGQRNQCQACKEYFNSNFAFVKHRTGKFGIDRRCMTKPEMEGKGMRLNDKMFWVGNENKRFVEETQDE